MNKQKIFELVFPGGLIVYITGKTILTAIFGYILQEEEDFQYIKDCEIEEIPSWKWYRVFITDKNGKDIISLSNWMINNEGKEGLIQKNDLYVRNKESDLKSPKINEQYVRSTFRNNFNCYADADEVILAMTEDKFVESVKKLNIIK